MTAIVTDYLSTKIVRHLLGFETLPVVTNLRLALYSTSEGIQTDTPTGELTDVNYEKHAVVFTEITPLIGQPLWYEAGKVSLELLAVD